MLGMLPMLLASYGIVTIGRLREVAIMIEFMLPLTLEIRFGSRPSAIATVVLILGCHF